MASGPIRRHTDTTIRVSVRLTPKASRNGVKGVANNADGSFALGVSVTTVPEAGKANAALIKLLAKEWRVAKSSLTIVAGTTDRNKVIEIETPDAAALYKHLNQWLAQATATEK